MSGGFTISGLVSGLDTATIVSQLMQLERIPVVNMQRQQSRLRLADAAFADIATRLSSLRETTDGFREVNGGVGGFTQSVASNDNIVQINSSSGASEGSFTFTVDQLATSHQAASADSFADGDALVGAGTFTINVDGVDHDIVTDGTTTLNELSNQINELGIDVSAQALQVDDGDYRLVLSAKNTGEDGQFTVTSTSANMTTPFDTLATGQNALLSIGEGVNALQISRSSNTITDVIDGVSFTLLEESAETQTITTTRDDDELVEKMQAFVDQLNSALTAIKDKTKSDPEGDADGPLSGESLPRRLRDALTSAVANSTGDGAFAIASQLGIEINRDGTFDFDESDFRDALAEDAEAVESFLTGDNGIGETFDAVLDTFEGSTGLIKLAQDSIDSRIGVLDDRIERFEARLVQREEFLRRQFTAMEDAIANLQGQSNFLFAQLGQQG